MKLFELAVSFSLFATASAANDKGCSWSSVPVSDSPAVVSVESLESIGDGQTLDELVRLIGPATRDVGSGIYMLEWQLDDGRQLRASARAPCSQATLQIMIEAHRYTDD
jgi:hypothetical protein